MTLPLAQDPQDRPQTAALDPAVKAELDALVQNNDLVLFMKGTPDMPRCGFSQRAAQVYKATGRDFVAVDVFSRGEDPMVFIRQLAQWADWPTLPQCWVKGELIGGSDIALEMFESGELQTMLDES